MADAPDDAPLDAPPVLPLRLLTTEFCPEVDRVPDLPDCGTIRSKIGGTPAWAQDIVEIPDHRYVLQFYESDIVAFSRPHVGIFAGGNGFLFLKSPLIEGGEGAFFIQFT